MPSVSKVQQQAAGLALAVKRGKVPLKSLNKSGAARQMYRSMSESQLREFASTKRKGLPKRKKK